ncbi:MAG: SAM-dependent methyltransferase [Clostridiales bacterium]|nr:SAM-dependent methyltransferase [Clostridiales bacterium]
MEELRTYFSKMIDAGTQKIVISKQQSKQEEYKRITVEKKGNYYQIARYTEKQVFHKNVRGENAADCCAAAMDGHFLQANGWSSEFEYILLCSKKGTCTFKRKRIVPGAKATVQTCTDKAEKNKANLARMDMDKAGGETDEESGSVARSEYDASSGAGNVHNRKKNYILKEGFQIPPLVDMGIFTAEGKVVHSMYDKYRQINRFIEIIDDEIQNWKGDTIHVIDFGCGKSYLTFVLYYYLTEIREIRAEVVGLDLKADVIKKCNQSAEKYGYDGLHFEVGNINGYQPSFDVDMVITLHACDTATDYTLYNAITWKAGLIFSVPCCQHELNRQIHAENLSLLTRYGIIKERFSALATDAIRANLLEFCGYKTQLLEFIDFEHTPKNLLIRASRRAIAPKGARKKALDEVKAVMEEFSLKPTLYTLLYEDDA